MFKARVNTQIETSQKGADQIERLMEVLPKRCSCSACEAIKQEAKEKLGKDKYNTILNNFGIVE